MTTYRYFYISNKGLTTSVSESQFQSIFKTLFMMHLPFKRFYEVKYAKNSRIIENSLFY